MNEPTVSDERLKQIEARATHKIYPVDDHVPTVRDALYGSDSPDIAAMARELLSRREADRLAEIAERVPSEEELRTIAAPAGGGE